jgi:hypothetical protein
VYISNVPCGFRPRTLIRIRSSCEDGRPSRLLSAQNVSCTCKHGVSIRVDTRFPVRDSTAPDLLRWRSLKTPEYSLCVTKTGAPAPRVGPQASSPLMVPLPSVRMRMANRDRERATHQVKESKLRVAASLNVHAGSLARAPAHDRAHVWYGSTCDSA